MKKLISTVIAVALVLYGLCYIDKNGTDELPNVEEYTEYVLEKKDEAVETYYAVKEWLTEHEFFE